MLLLQRRLECRGMPLFQRGCVPSMGFPRKTFHGVECWERNCCSHTTKHGPAAHSHITAHGFGSPFLLSRSSETYRFEQCGALASASVFHLVQSQSLTLLMLLHRNIPVVAPEQMKIVFDGLPTQISHAILKYGLDQPLQTVYFATIG